MEHVDVLIVGAGWHGLVNAKTYLEVHPEAKVLVVDGAQSVGGVWAEERLYPGLKTNNMLGTYEFSDFPMTEERLGVKPGQHIPGQVVHRYLHQYAEEFGLLSIIRLGCRVITAEMKGNSQWELTTMSNNENENTPHEDHILASKLILATGLTSDPIPTKT